MEAKVIQMFGNAQPPKCEKTFIEILKEYCEKKIIEKRLKVSKFLKQGYLIQNVEEFLESRDTPYLKVGEVGIELIEELLRWLQNKNCKTGYAFRHAKLCRGAMGYAVEMEYFLHNPLGDIKLLRDKAKKVVNLNMNHMDKIIKDDFEKPAKRSVEFSINVKVDYR